MIKDANFIAEKIKVAKKLMSEAMNLQEKRLDEDTQGQDKVTFKFEFVGIDPGDTSKVLIKFNSPALSLALMNNKAKGGDQKYAYLSNFVQMAKQTLQTQTGINPLQFEAQKSNVGDLVFSVNRELAKSDLTQLVQLQALSVVVKATSGQVQQQPAQPEQPAPEGQPPTSNVPSPQTQQAAPPQKTIAQPKQPIK